MTRHRYVTSRRIDDLHPRLTDADWAVLETLRRVRVATGLQLQHVHHGRGEAAKQRRLRQLSRLSRLQVLTRWERRVVGGVGGGSASTVYTLDAAGLRLLDRSGNARRPWQPSSPFVAHAVAVTQLYVDLVEAERAGGLELLRFNAEPRCWRHYASRRGVDVTLKPDADVTVAEGDFEHHWFVEVDRATESRPRLLRKAGEYLDFYRSGIEQAARGVTPRVLYVVPTERRRADVLDVFSRLDAEHWHLFAVCLPSEAVAVLGGQRGEGGR